MDEAEDAIEARAIVGLRFPGDDLAAQGFEHFAAFGYEIGDQIVHWRAISPGFEATYAGEELTRRYPCLGRVAPIMRTSLAGSESWIEPPASEARLWASQAPAARG